MRRSVLIRAALVFTGLNLGWELLQLPLYTIWWTEPWSRIIFALLRCTAGDLIIGSLALCAALLLVGQEWPHEPRTRLRVTVLTTLLGVGYTVASEWLNVVVRQTWAYTQAMPRLPPFGTGLSPVLQWLLLPGLALYLTAGAGSEPGRKAARDP